MGLIVAHRANQDAVKRGGGVEALVALLAPLKLSEHTATAVAANTTLDATEALHATHEEMQANAADALSELSRSHSTNRDAVVGAGAIGSLVSLLEVDKHGADASTQSARAQEAAARCLWSLAEGNVTSQEEVARAGGLMPLVALLGSE